MIFRLAYFGSCRRTRRSELSGRRSIFRAIGRVDSTCGSVLSGRSTKCRHPGCNNIYDLNLHSEHNVRNRVRIGTQNQSSLKSKIKIFLPAAGFAPFKRSESRSSTQSSTPTTPHQFIALAQKHVFCPSHTIHVLHVFTVDGIQLKCSVVRKVPRLHD